MNNNKILETGYVVMVDEDDYCTSNVGIFKTKRNAERCCEKIKYRYPNAKVVKVNLVIADE